MNASFVKVINNFHFRVLWLSQIISQIALNMLSFVLAIAVYQKTYSNTAVSLMLLTFGLPAIVFGVVFGGIVDNFDKRSILVLSNFTRGLILIGYFFLSLNLYMLYALTVFMSIFTQLFIPAEAPAIPQLVKKEDLLSANSLFTITFYLSTVIGALTAGTMLRLFGNQNIYLVMASFMFLATFFTSRLPRLKPAKHIKFEFDILHLVKPIYEGFLFIHQQARIRQSLYLLTFSQALVATLIVLAPGFADKILLIDIKDVSLLVMGPAAIGLIMGAYLVGNFAKRFLRGTIILAGIITTGVVLILLSILSTISYNAMIYLIALLLLILGIANSFINVPTSTILQEETDKSLRGRIYGVLTALTGGLSILPVLLSGILADVVGIERTLSTIGIVVLAIGLYYIRERGRVITLN